MTSFKLQHALSAPGKTKLSVRSLLILGYILAVLLISGLARANAPGENIAPSVFSPVP